MKTYSWLLVFIALFAGLLAFFVNQEASLIHAFIVLFTASWLLYRFSSGEKIWKTLAMLTNPFMTAIIGFLLGFSYTAFKGETVSNSFLFALGTSLAGGALGIFFWNYWNIGD